MRRFICLVLTLALLFCCSGCEKKVQQTLFCMDTVMDLQLWGADADIACAGLLSTLTTLESSWSALSEDSILWQLNHNNSLFQIEPGQAALLEKLKTLSARTGGAFDPQLGAVTAAWGFYAKDYRIPSPQELDTALAAEQWDLGGALKGYAADQCVEILEQLRISRAVLNLGGNIQTYGQKADGTPWQIGIQNPSGGDPLGVLSVKGTMAVVTSGSYQRYFEENGVRYHHIIDPTTGYPADSGLTSVTIVSANGITADVLSTALFVMGLDAGTAFWQQSNDFEAVFVTASGQIYVTEGIVLTGCEYEVIEREN